MILGQEVHKKSLNYIYKRTRNLENSKDILQDAYIEYFLKKDRIKHENHEGYFYCIVKHKTIEYFRRNQIKEKVFEDISFEELNSKSYNDGPYNHDMKVLSSTKMPEFLESRMTFSKRHIYCVMEGNKKIFNKRKSKNGPQAFSYSIKDSDKLTKEEAIKLLADEFKYDKFKEEVEVKLKADSDITLIRLHAKGFNAIKTNSVSFCMRHYNNNTGNEKTKRWIQII